MTMAIHICHLCFIWGVKFCELAVNHAASTNILFDQKVSTLRNGCCVALQQ